MFWSDGKAYILVAEVVSLPKSKILNLHLGLCAEIQTLKFHWNFINAFEISRGKFQYKEKIMQKRHIDLRIS